MSVSYGGDSITFADGSVTSSGWTGFKNRIINGAMTISQSANGSSVTLPDGNSSYLWAVDRFPAGRASTATATTQQVADAPTGSGLYYSLKWTTGTAASGAADSAYVFQPIEGNNITDLMWGSAYAKTCTLSFWVKSSLSGQFSGSIMNSGPSRSYPFIYTINSANTWEYKTITITGETTGTWLTNTGRGISVLFDLGSGSNYLNSSPSTWTSSTIFGISGSVKVGNTANATWQITGVQFEKGSTASSFEYRPYTTELQLCQRYYYRWKQDNSATIYPFVLQVYNSTSAFGKLLDFPVTMRAVPTCSAIGTFFPHTAAGNSAGAFNNLGSLSASTSSLATGSFSGASGLTAGNATGIGVSANGYIEMNSEL